MYSMESAGIKEDRMLDLCVESHIEFRELHLTGGVTLAAGLLLFRTCNSIPCSDSLKEQNLEVTVN